MRRMQQRELCHRVPPGGGRGERGTRSGEQPPLTSSPPTSSAASRKPLGRSAPVTSALSSAATPPIGVVSAAGGSCGPLPPNYRGVKWERSGFSLSPLPLSPHRGAIDIGYHHARGGGLGALRRYGGGGGCQGVLRSQKDVVLAPLFSPLPKPAMTKTEDRCKLCAPCAPFYRFSSIKRCV